MISRSSSADPRAIKARQSILEATLALLEERAASDISVGDIAATASVSRQAFYSHFKDRQHAVERAVRDDILRSVRPTPEARSNVSPSDVVEAAIDLIRLVHQRTRVIEHLRLDAATYNMALAAWHEVLHPWCRHLIEQDSIKHHMSDGLHAEDAAEFLTHGLVGLLMAIGLGNPGIPLPDLRKRLLQQTLRFLGHPTGRPTPAALVK